MDKWYTVANFIGIIGKWRNYAKLLSAPADVLSAKYRQA